jgi:hypothetical protein
MAGNTPKVSANSWTSILSEQLQERLANIETRLGANTRQKNSTSLSVRRMALTALFCMTTLCFFQEQWLSVSS